MCLIVVKNKTDAVFTMEEFKASQFRNSDGTGIMYVDNGRVLVNKVFSALPADHANFFEQHMNRPTYVLHHRFATQGEKSELNVHPFKVLSKDDGDPYDLYFAHNGNIPISKFSTDRDIKLSDTHLFAVEYLAPIIKKFPSIIEDKVFQTLIHEMIGMGNKLVFLRSDNRIWIFNKSQGSEHNGCWLSNTYSIAAVPAPRSNVTTFGRNHGTNTHDENLSGYDYDDGMWWRENYNRANKLSVKAYDMLSDLSIDELLTAIQEYKDLPVSELEMLFLDSPELVVDMVNLLSDKTDKKLIDASSNEVADKAFDLLQTFSKKVNKAAA